MPYYIYLTPQGSFSNDVHVLWSCLKDRISSGALPDFASLQYPPHVTVSGSFDMSDYDMKCLIADIKDIFGSPFYTSVNTQWKRKGAQIASLDFQWVEFSQRVTVLKEKYPALPWVVDGYHITLLHAPSTDKARTPIAMSRAARLLPKISKLAKDDFSITVWKYSTVQSAKYSWDSRVWDIVYTSAPFSGF
jgi:hypothetical protein